MTSALTRRSLGLMAATGAAALGGLSAAPPAVAQEMGGDWFDMIRHQHREIDRLLTSVMNASSPEARGEAFRRFSAYIAAHSIAEETSIYPALALNGADDQSRQLYHEQDDAKVLIARIDMALFMHHDQDVPGLLQQLSAALHAHVAEEENQDFPRLKAMLSAPVNAKITRDFAMEFQRAAS